MADKTPTSKAKTKAAAPKAAKAAAPKTVAAEAPKAAAPKAVKAAAPKAVKAAAPKAVKAAAPKADKAAAPKADKAAVTTTASRPAASTDDVARLAFEIFVRRMEQGTQGDAVTDWLAAERELNG